MLEMEPVLLTPQCPCQAAGVAIRGGVMAGALGAACRVMGGPTHSWATGAASRACLLQVGPCRNCHGTQCMSPLSALPFTSLRGTCHAL